MNTSMKKYLPVFIYGTIIILVGVFLLFSAERTFQVIKLFLGIALIIASIFGFLTIINRQWKQVSFLYHEMHAMTMLVYGIGILLFCNTLESVINFTSFLFFFYAFSEVIFCNWLFNLGKKINFRIILIRLVLSLIVGVGVIVIIYYPSLRADTNLEHFGLLFLIVGVNLWLYVPILKTKEITGVFE
jgi:uncharacterized membrane protein HdeD (DUF308 family)